MALSEKDQNLIDACQNGDAEKVRELLTAGADVAARDKGGWTPLHYATGNGHTGIAKLLLGAGADHAARDNRGGTPLHVAEIRHRTDIATLLLEAGADMDEATIDGLTPRQIAAAKDYTDVITGVLANEANEAAQGDAGNTPPSLAAGIGGFAGIVGCLAVWLVLTTYSESLLALASKLRVLEDARFGVLCAKAMSEHELKGFRSVLLNDCPPLQDDGGLLSEGGGFAVRLLPATDGGGREYEVTIALSPEPQFDPAFASYRRLACVAGMLNLSEQKHMFTRVTLNGRVIHPEGEGSPGESEDYGCVDGENTLVVVGI